MFRKGREVVGKRAHPKRQTSKKLSFGPRKFSPGASPGHPESVRTSITSMHAVLDPLKVRRRARTPRDLARACRRDVPSCFPVSELTSSRDNAPTSPAPPLAQDAYLALADAEGKSTRSKIVFALAGAPSLDDHRPRRSPRVLQLGTAPVPLFFPTQRLIPPRRPSPSPPQTPASSTA